MGGWVSDGEGAFGSGGVRGGDDVESEGKSEQGAGECCRVRVGGAEGVLTLFICTH